MEAKFNLLAPHMYFYGDNRLYFSVCHSPGFVSRTINDIITKHMGELKLFFRPGEEETLKEHLQKYKGERESSTLKKFLDWIILFILVPTVLRLSHIGKDYNWI